MVMKHYGEFPLTAPLHPLGGMRDVCEAPGSDGGGVGSLRGLTGCRSDVF